MTLLKKSVAKVALSLLFCAACVQVVFANILPTPVQIIALQGPTPSPLRLLHFTATCGTHTPAVELSWTAAVQSQMRVFQVESSLDGSSWQLIGEVPAVSGGSGTSQYGYEDMRFSEGQNYYRLRFVDENDSFSFSPVVIVRATRPDERSSVFPNPASTLVHIHTIESKVKPAAVTLLTLGGVPIEREAAGTSEECTIAVDHVPAGLYLLKLHYPDHDVIDKVMIAH